MKKQFSKIAILLTVIVAMAACKKENQSTTTIASGWWIKTAQTSTNISTGDVSDVFATLPTCQKDDQFRFNTSGTFSTNPGSTKCSVAEPDIIETAGAWSITDNKFTLDAGILVLSNGEIVENTSSRLRVAFPYSTGSNTFTITMTFTHL